MQSTFVPSILPEHQCVEFLWIDLTRGMALSQMSFSVRLNQSTSSCGPSAVSVGGAGQATARAAAIKRSALISRSAHLLGSIFCSSVSGRLERGCRLLAISCLRD